MKRLFPLVTLVILTLSFVLPSWAATYTWKMTSPLPPGPTFNWEIKKFASTLEERAGGAVKFTIYEGTLGAPTDTWDMTKGNVIQFCYTFNSFNSNRLAVLNLADLPFEISDPKSCKLIIDAWYQAGYLNEVTDSFKILWLMPTAPLHVSFTNKKVVTLDDWKDIKVRTPSAAHGLIIKALGGSAVSMPSSEVYMAMSTGVLDGFITSVESIINHKFYEVAKYALRTPPICFGIFMFMMNKDIWNSIPADLQDKIDQVAREVAEEALNTTQNGLGPLWKEAESKMEVYDIDEAEIQRWRQATAGITEKYLKEKEGSKYPVKEAYEMMKKMAAEYANK